MSERAFWAVARVAALTLSHTALALALLTFHVAAKQVRAPKADAIRICTGNGGNRLMQLQGLEEGLKGWRCYHFANATDDPEWIGPDILAKRSTENKSGWEVWTQS